MSKVTFTVHMIARTGDHYSADIDAENQYTAVVAAKEEWPGHVSYVATLDWHYGIAKSVATALCGQKLPKKYSALAKPLGVLIVDVLGLIERQGTVTHETILRIAKHSLGFADTSQADPRREQS